MQNVKSWLFENIKNLTVNQENDQIKEQLLLDNKILTGDLLVLEKTLKIGTFTLK